MKKRLLWASLLAIILGLMWIPSLREVLGTESSLASNYDHTYTFNVQYGPYQFSHRLYTSVPPSLYDYYHGKTHSLSYDGYYSRFVTPSAFESIAESIQNFTRNVPYSDEQFANAVLRLVHQLPYAIGDMRYPIETLVDNSGKCDTLSLLAASIMKAGGLDVVLLYYGRLSPSHMNVGVHLPYTPAYHTWWMTPIGYEYDNKTYWMAECTSLGEWKVGDQPGLLAGVKPQIIPLENCEESSPAKVSSSLDSPLIPSSISIDLSPENSSITGEPTLTISGSISPAYSGKSVVMYVGQNGSSCNTLSTVTDDLGNYSLTWNFTSTGTYYIRTSWSGASNYAGADSETLTVFIGFHQPLVESEVPEYYWGAGPDYVFARAYAFPGYENFVRQSVKEFLKSNLTGTGVVLSGEFIILKGGQTITISKSEQTTISRGEQTIRIPGRRYIILPRTEQTTTITESEQTISNQFGFILRHNGGNNYTASVKVLNDYDMSQITKRLDGNNTAFMNATMDTKENTWYKVVARISEDEITTELYDGNGTLLKNIATKDDAMNTSEPGILMTNATVIAFKNLKAETLDQPTTPVDDNQPPVKGLELLAPYSGLVILLAIAVAAIAYIKERKRVTEKQTTEP